MQPQRVKLVICDTFGGYALSKTVMSELCKIKNRYEKTGKQTIYWTFDTICKLSRNDKDLVRVVEKYISVGPNKRDDASGSHFGMSVRLKVVDIELKSVDEKWVIGKCGGYEKVFIKDGQGYIYPTHANGRRSLKPMYKTTPTHNLTELYFSIK